MVQNESALCRPLIPIVLPVACCLFLVACLSSCRLVLSVAANTHCDRGWRNQYYSYYVLASNVVITSSCCLFSVGLFQISFSSLLII